MPKQTTIIQLTVFSLVLFLSLLVVRINSFVEMDQGNCKNGGLWDQDLNKCNCTRNFSNKDCNTKFCGNDGDLNEQTNKCECEDEDYFTGRNCFQCVSNSSCTVHRPMCDHSMLVHNQRNFNCEVLSGDISKLFGNKLDFQCKRNDLIEFPVAEPLNSTFTCNAQIWSNLTELLPLGKLVQVLYCDFKDCTIILEKKPNGNDKLEYHCNGTECECVGPKSKCNEDLSYFVKTRMKGLSSVHCLTKSKTCKLVQSNLPSEIDSVCKSSECVELPYNGNGNRPHEPLDSTVARNLFIAISGLLASLVFLFGLSCCLSCCHDIRATREYKNNKDRISEVRINTKELSYFIWQRKGFYKTKKQILFGINLEIKSGELVAILGKSGAGKTTLLDILSNRTKTGITTGELLINKEKINAYKYRRQSGFVPNSDIFIGELTVKETLMFCADTRLAACIGKEQKNKIINDIIKDVGLEDVKNNKVGTAGNRGLSDGEKKRVSIAIELIISPDIIFLDEPTSGLDSATSYRICKMLRVLSERGKTIVMSIHNPGKDIYDDCLTNVILMSKGRVLYHGKSKRLVRDISSKDRVYRLGENPSVFAIDALEQKEYDHDYQQFEISKKKYTATESDLKRKKKTQLDTNNNNNNHTLIYTDLNEDVEIGDGELNKDSISIKLLEDEDDGVMDINENSPRRRKISIELENITETYEEDTTLDDMTDFDEDDEGFIELYDNGKKSIRVNYAISFYRQLYYLSLRNLKTSLRNFLLIPAHNLVAILIGVLLSIVFADLEYDLVGCQNRMGIIFFITLVLALCATTVIKSFLDEKEVYKHQIARGYYTPTAYFISKIMFDLVLLRIMPALLMGGIPYFFMGLKPGILNYVYFLLILTIFNCINSLMCLSISFVFPSISGILSIFLILTNLLFSGVLLNQTSLPAYLNWLHYLSFWNYTLEFLLSNELHLTKVIFNPKGLPGIVLEGVGDFYLKQFGMDASNMWIDFGVLLGTFAILFVLSSLLLRVCVKEKE